jgi:hypothetical protein
MHPLEPKRQTINEHYFPGYHVEPSKAVWYTCSGPSLTQGQTLTISSTDGLLMATDFRGDGSADVIIGHLRADGYITLDLSVHPEAPLDPLKECCRNCQDFKNEFDAHCEECILSSCGFHPYFRLKDHIKKAILTGEEILPLPNTDLIL